MLDYEKFTKKELVDKLNEQEFLSQAVEAKDKEIVDLTGRIKRLEDSMDLFASDTRHSIETKDSEISRLNSKIKENEHLAKAVEAKDNEISSLTYAKAKEIADVKANQEKIKASLEYEVQDLRKRIAEMPNVEKLNEAIANLQNENTKIIKFANQYINAFRNYLKQEQGNLENIVELEALITETIKSNKEA